MKRFLVLTGTAGYAMLEKSVVDLAAKHSEYSFLLQTVNDVQASERVEHKNFVNMNAINLEEFDGIIGHCGAGTTFWALEAGARFLAVVNLDRRDNHQSDLGDWLKKHNHALVAYNRPLEPNDLEQLLSTEFTPYVKEHFVFSNFDKFLA